MKPRRAQKSNAPRTHAAEVPCFSLTSALAEILRSSGHTVDVDDLNAALGLSWMAIAVPGEPDPGCWPMYARDAFLVEAGRLFGMTIRDMHPPEAARGLSDAPEFTQHFDASYRPLILRALENGQPIIVWQGWPGDRRLLWGQITDPCDDGIGLAGVVPAAEELAETFLPKAPQVSARADSRERPEPRASARANAQRPRSHTTPSRHAAGEVAASDPVALTSPPVQLYVVETISPTQPDPSELLALALAHAEKVLNNALADRFGVITGPPAYDAWIEHSKEVGRALPAEAVVAAQHRRLVGSIIGMHQSASRFLGRLRTRTSQLVNTPLADLEKLCGDIVRVLREAMDPARLEAGEREQGSRDRLTAVLEQARDLTKAMRDTLGAA